MKEEGRVAAIAMSSKPASESDAGFLQYPGYAVLYSVPEAYVREILRYMQGYLSRVRARRVPGLREEARVELRDLRHQGPRSRTGRLLRGLEDLAAERGLPLRYLQRWREYYHRPWRVRWRWYTIDVYRLPGERPADLALHAIRLYAGRIEVATDTPEVPARIVRARAPAELRAREPEERTAYTVRAHAVGPVEVEVIRGGRVVETHPAVEVIEADPTFPDATVRAVWRLEGVEG